MKKKNHEHKWWHNNGWLIPLVVVIAICVFLLPEKNSRNKTEKAETSPITAQVAPPQDAPEKRVEKVDSLIAGVEKESEALKKIIASKKNLNPNLKKMMLETLEIVKINRGNMQRNYAKLLVDITKDGRMSVKNPNYFFYDTLTDLGNECAVYSPPKKTIGLKPEFNPTNRVDMVIFFHEMQHVIQDNRVRYNLKSKEEFDKYMAFFTARSTSGERAAILDDEVIAYALEIELINLLSDEYLKNQVAAGKPIDMDELGKKLGVTSEQAQQLNTVIAAVDVYYPQGIGGKTIPEKFVQYWADLYTQMGYKIARHR